MNFDEERGARNEAAFRRANEQIALVQSGLETDDDPSPFLCECDDPSCVEVLFLRRSEYEDVRGDGRRFAVVPGHDGGTSRLVLEREGFSVVEKRGRAGEIAVDLDTRGQGRHA